MSIGEVIELRPNPGPQEQFLASHADIAIYGGQAGGGKSYALLLDPLRFVDVPGFGAVIFRRNATDLTQEGGLWDESMKIYPAVGGRPRESMGKLDYRFKAKSRISFAHLAQEDTVDSKQGGQIPMIGFDELTHFCLTDDHEVLTENGWKKITDVKVGEKVPSLASDRNIVMSEVTDVPTFDYEGDLLECDQRNGLSFRVTPNHRMVVDKQDDAMTWTFMRADHVERTHQTIPRTGKWHGNEMVQMKFQMPSGRGIGRNANISEHIDGDDYLALLGWYMSEGSAFLAARSQGGTSPCVSIRQTKTQKELAGLMGRLPYRVRLDGDGGYRIFSRQLYDHLKPLGNSKTKRLPRWILSLSVRQQRIFFDAFVAGDGHINASEGITIGLCNEGLIDDLQEISFYCGLTATKGFNKTKTGFDVWRLSISERSGCMVRKGQIKRERYVGKVHCLTVANTETFLIRRNGRVSWTGNTKYQFFYMLSRNRSNCGVKPYMRATCNPDPDSWVADFLAWWIDQAPKLSDGTPNPNYGHAIQERSGKIRWMAKIDDDIHWFDRKEDAKEFMINAGRTPRPLSVTFIHATLDDNPKMNGREDYISKLEALDRISRERLLKGNWKVRATAGLVFKRSDFKIMELEDFNEKDITRRVRRWDFAGTEAAKATTPGRMSAKLIRGPDWTVGLKLVMMRNKDIVIVDMIRCQKKPGDVEELVTATAKLDGRKVTVIVPQDPGQAGKAQVEHYVKLLMGYTVHHDRETGSKLVRATPYAAYAQHGHVYLLRAAWNDVFLAEHEAFPTDGVPDDIVDTGSGGYLALTEKGPSTAELMAQNKVRMQ